MTLLTICALILLATAIGLLVRMLVGLDSNRPDTETSLAMRRFTLALKNMERAFGELWTPELRRLARQMERFSAAYRKGDAP